MDLREVLTIKGDCANFAIAPDASAAEAVAKMKEYDIGSLLVMDQGRMAGLVTERMLLRGLGDRAPAQMRVEEVMAQEPLTAHLDDSVDYAREVMTRQRMSHLIVFDGERMAGIISFHDVARACMKDASFENAMLKRYIKNWPEGE